MDPPWRSMLCPLARCLPESLHRSPGSEAACFHTWAGLGGRSMIRGSWDSPLLLIANCRTCTRPQGAGRSGCLLCEPCSSQLGGGCKVGKQCDAAHVCPASAANEAHPRMEPLSWRLSWLLLRLSSCPLFLRPRGWMGIPPDPFLARDLGPLWDWACMVYTSRQLMQLTTGRPAPA